MSKCCGSHPDEGEPRGRNSLLGRKINNVCRKREAEPHLEGKLSLHPVITQGFISAHRDGGMLFIYPKPFTREEILTQARRSFLQCLQHKLDPLYCRLLCWGMLAPCRQSMDVLSWSCSDRQCLRLYDHLPLNGLYLHSMMWKEP